MDTLELLEHDCRAHPGAPDEPPAVVPAGPIAAGGDPKPYRLQGRRLT